MKLLTLSVLLGLAAARPSSRMSETLLEIRKYIRPGSPGNHNSHTGGQTGHNGQTGPGSSNLSAQSTELIGDLVNLPWYMLSQSGAQIRSILEGFSTNPESDEAYTWPVPELSDNVRCAQDTCCVWKHIADEMTAIFRNDDGTCTEFARKAVRMGFHDAGAWSKQNPTVGGADGSLVLSDELTRKPNAGLAPMGDKYRAFYDKYHTQLGYSAVTMADLLQFGANVATVVCPLGPRVRSWVGRVDNAAANTDGLLPSPFNDAPTLISLFQDKTIQPHGLIALLGAHTTSEQEFVNTTLAGAPQDSTPGVWDVKFYGETSGLTTPPAEVFSFPSDLSLAQDPTTAGDFKFFAGPNGQQAWNRDYAREYIRLSLLGVQNINKLVECTKALPAKTH